MGTRSILEIARDVAVESNLQPPVTLFGSLDEDESGRKLLRAAHFVCRYLEAKYQPIQGLVVGNVGKKADNTNTGPSFGADTDTAWPPDELLHLGMLWRLETRERLAAPDDDSQFHMHAVEWAWPLKGDTEPYSTIDAGFPRATFGRYTY